MDLVKTKSFQLATYSKGDKNSKKLALVLPGKLDTKDYSHMKSHVNHLADLGFYALSFDPPGTWESKGDISLYNTTSYLKAVDELIEHFGNKPTFVMGHSRGASVAMIAGTRNPAIKSFVPIMPSFSERGFDHTRDEKWKTQGFIVSLRDLPPGGGPKIKEFRLPYSFFEDQLKYEMTNDLKSSQKPKLIIVGNKDANVSPDQVRELFFTLSKPKELYELKSDHNYRLDSHLIDEVNQVVEKFIQDYNV